MNKIQLQICFLPTFLFIIATSGLTIDKKTNVIMLFVDDLGYGDLGFTGHPTTKTPNLDKLAKNGKILSNFYSAYPVCSASRASLMTGRQPDRIGVPGVFGPTVNVGLPLNETTLGDQFKKAGYATAIMGKWHLGQRQMFLPGSRGFDTYLGIPYSDDMGGGRATPCNNYKSEQESVEARKTSNAIVTKAKSENEWYHEYCSAGFCDENDKISNEDPAGTYLPLVYQTHDTHDHSLNTTVLEQPLDFTTLDEKYNNFVKDFITKHKDSPFFLYMPFSHVHTTNTLQPEQQYCGCDFKNKTSRGAFGDALAEVDWLVGNLIEQLQLLDLSENTLIMFTGDNGPWMVHNESAGSPGIFYGRSSGYWNVGKGSTWEGGVHEAAFAYWPGKIKPGTRTDQTISTMDIFPTISKLIGVDLPENVILDGKDMSDILFDENGGKSKHEFLYFYGGAKNACSLWKGPSAVRYKAYKAHFATGPGLSGCAGCEEKCYCKDPTNGSVDCTPLLFNILIDPSEAYPITDEPEIIAIIVKGLQQHLASFPAKPKLIPPPDGPGEGPNKYGVCCDRKRNCDCSGPLP
jgi:arylsulfatase A